jgi:hypothetical protein
MLRFIRHGKAILLAGVLVSACFFADRPSLAGTGGGLQVPNPPVDRFTQPGAPGLCQCTAPTSDNDRDRTFKCLPSAAECQSTCGRVYAFVPDTADACPVSSDKK